MILRVSLLVPRRENGPCFRRARGSIGWAGPRKPDHRSHDKHRSNSPQSQVADVIETGCYVLRMWLSSAGEQQFSFWQKLLPLATRDNPAVGNGG